MMDKNIIISKVISKLSRKENDLSSEDTLVRSTNEILEILKSSAMSYSNYWLKIFKSHLERHQISLLELKNNKIRENKKRHLTKALDEFIKSLKKDNNDNNSKEIELRVEDIIENANKIN